MLIYKWNLILDLFKSFYKLTSHFEMLWQKEGNRKGPASSDYDIPKSSDPKVSVVIYEQDQNIFLHFCFW